MIPELRLLLATNRATIRDCFVAIGGQARPPFVVDQIPLPLDVEEAVLELHSIADAAAAVVDVSLDPVTAIELCLRLHRLRPALPLVTLPCCPYAVQPWHLASLTAAGVASVLDLQGTFADVQVALHNAARGDLVLHLQLTGKQGASLHGVLAGNEHDGTSSTAVALSESNIQLLRLLTSGLSDREMGERLHLSPHTIKHRIERLRDAAGAKNRTELAAWAGLRGIYRPDDRVRQTEQANAQQGNSRASAQWRETPTRASQASHVDQVQHVRQAHQWRRAQ
ncbi:MAG: response regulator transcription factor [Chloroflexi bacterium]|nr:response regulator transcription factor [Chloroflexota bacterium]